ncbi:MAG: hypothetical protein Fur0023_02670 [Bacteroidia bacterium]
MSKQIFSYFQFDPFNESVSFFYCGAEQHLKVSDSSNFSLVWGAYFCKKGYRYIWKYNTGNGNEINIRDIYNFYYINFPLFVQKKVWQNLYLSVGWVPSIMLYNRENYLFETKVTSSTATLPPSKLTDTNQFGESTVNFVDLSVRLGLSYYFNRKWGMDFYYDKGLINVSRNKVPAIGYQNIWLLGMFYKL